MTNVMTNPIRIRQVARGSVAEKLGLTVGMQIAMVSDTNCLDSSQNMVLSLLAIRPVTVELLLPEGVEMPEIESPDAPKDGFEGGETPEQLAAAADGKQSPTKKQAKSKTPKVPPPPTPPPPTRARVAHLSSHSHARARTAQSTCFTT
jgi:hypothetical protein